VYVFARSSGTWAQEAYLKAANAAAQDEFGCSVGIDGHTIVVGGRYEDSDATSITNGATANDNNNASKAGAAYVFVRSSGTWAQEAYLKAANAERDDAFGYIVGIHGDTVVVGAPKEDSSATSITNGATANTNNSASLAGAAYVFARSSGTWAQGACLKAANAGAQDSFGYSVGVDGDTIVVGAYFEDSDSTSITHGAASLINSSSNTGAVYVFYNYPPTGAPTGTPTGTPTTGNSTTGNPTTGNRTTVEDELDMATGGTTGCSYQDVIKSCEEKRGAYAWTCSTIQVQLKVCASCESEVQRLESEVQRLRALLGSS